MIAAHLADRIGAIFDARISGVVGAGLFVTLNESGADGFVPASTLWPATISSMTKRGTRWSAREPARPIRLGDRVEVELKEVTPVSGGHPLRNDFTRPQRQAPAPPAGGGSRQSKTRREAPLSDVSARGSPVRADPAPRPRDSATLILVRSDGPELRVLMGRRHERHSFMPGKFVFPGGAVDEADAQVCPAVDLDSRSLAKLMLRMRGRPSARRARALAMAAVRETFEETGLILGRPFPVFPWVTSGGVAAVLRSGLRSRSLATGFCCQSHHAARPHETI